MARTTVYLVRHGEQDSVSGPTPDGGLSELGREQAHRTGRRLREVPFSAIHHSPLRRATETTEIIAEYLPDVPRHACDLVADRTSVPLPGQEGRYPEQYRAWLAGVPHEDRDEGGAAIQAAVDHLGRTATEDRRELLITHNFVIGWFVRHALDAPVWRWMGLNQANCGLTIVQWGRHRAADADLLQRRRTPGRVSGPSTNIPHTVSSTLGEPARRGDTGCDRMRRALVRRGPAHSLQVLARLQS